MGSSGRADTGDNRPIIEWGKARLTPAANDGAKNRETIAQPLTPSKLLRKICQNIVGIDLSLLAVIAARPNHLLAPGPLLAHRGKELLEIPFEREVSTRFRLRLRQFVCTCYAASVSMMPQCARGNSPSEVGDGRNRR